ncbi:predicted protein [Verticillium alfalfae VaMs.102]|uniref:Predicted protein n=1 Tax=Verticillium alfalfae (strain VaMs.102 / ATCC MYA-4576 / FGSC 10136) TaxID=526221 RepID=C9SKG8_VERA1|nr:predicted protein [Verticillium alfalfae VaMs.102]EEY19186.1 predicted protein [Verticillium alfalfae VaMs.102]
MPIDREVPGIDAWVEVNGQRAEAYDDDDVSSREVNDLPARHQIFKYIESIDNASFTVQVHMSREVTQHALPPCDTVIGELFVDGKHVSSKCASVRPGQGTIDRLRFDGKKVESCSRPGYVHLLKLVFSAVSTVDDTDTARIASDLEAAKHLGLIQLRFFAGVDIGDTMAQRPDSTIPINTSELSEKSLKGKAISHGTSFSHGADLPASRHVMVDYVLGRQAFAVINFKYRSRRALQQEMILPRTPSPDPELQVLEGMSTEQVRRLAAQHLHSLHRPSRVKEENQAVAKTEQKPSVKRERDEVDLTMPPSQREWKYTKTANGARAVDLTEDDD